MIVYLVNKTRCLDQADWPPLVNMATYFNSTFLKIKVEKYLGFNVSFLVFKRIKATMTFSKTQISLHKNNS